MSYITAIGTATPPYKFSQATIADFMIRAMQLKGGDEKRLRSLFRATGIESRHSVLSDYGKQDGFDFYANTDNLEPFPSTKRRLESFRQHALGLSQHAVESCLKKVQGVNLNSITHLVVVSCTGMYAPGLDIDLVNSLKLNPNINRTCINFMGCYASFNALKLADTFCRANSNAKVLVVCTELCTLHFQKENTENNMLANALFADGSAAMLIESNPQCGLNLLLESFFCDLASEGEQDMAWSIGDLGFEMSLSAYVPEVIRKGISKLTASLLSSISRSLTDITYFAIHPGGKKILEAIEQELGIEKAKNKFSYQILKKFGNMSSPTVLFVIQDVMLSLTDVDDGKRILSFAFGPGLTLESMVLKIEKR